ncbi:MAG: hypothetical protein JXR73_16420 [Candidatus Omnitrophica bacterium]|nr:hypothetical protein [Candidatus Omnitrophota bacterium]
MLKVRTGCSLIVVFGACLFLLGIPGVKDAISAESSRIQLAPKPAQIEPDRRARWQPSVPSNYRETPFAESAPEPELTDLEKQRGYVLFQRPIIEPVYPNTRPRSYERLEGLSAFGAAGEFEPATFSVYPVRDLENFRVRASSLRAHEGVIDSSWITVRLVTYWNMGYPRYTSRDTYRRVPELLERVTVHSSPRGECQRWRLQIHVPSDAKPGVYKGDVTIWDDGFNQAVVIPLSFRVLGFSLKSDPAKHYSSYYYVRNSVQYKDKDEQFIKKATANEYRAMVDYGLDMLPTFSLQMDAQNEKIVVRYKEELDRMLKAGLKGPLPVTGGSVMSSIYRETTPDGKRENHWRISKMPPPEFYEKATALFKAFKEECRMKGWPEVICCPIDEVAASHKEFGWRVYKAVHESGIRTYATKNPMAADADPYRPYIDIWCSQPYSMPYEKITAQSRYEYWCYPNHNAGEIKDRRVMCKGGRMTYGFGFWKSGYTTLIPWNWNWTPAPDQFDYLRGSRSGCGQRIGDDGEVIPAVYWDCFREGRDDARYIYTLQQAIVERENSSDPQCIHLVKEGKAMLQEMWDAIDVQQKYLADGMWPSIEFNARRWRLAMMITSLLEHPAARHDAVAPSVLVQKIKQAPESNSLSIIEKAKRQNIIESKELIEPFCEWRNDTDEGELEATSTAGLDGEKGLRWRVKVDHEHDGGEGGQYPVGWPRLHRNFQDGDLDLSLYDYLDFNIRVDSDRDEVSDDNTPLGFLIGSHKQSRNLFTSEYDLGDRQRIWVPVRFSVKEMIESAGVGLEPWKSISKIQMYISEEDYAHGADITFDASSIELLRFTSPMISKLDIPRYVMLPRNSFPVPFQAVGMSSVKKGSHQIIARLVDKKGKTVSRTEQDLADNEMLVIDASNITPGLYTLSAEIMDAEGKHCSSITGAFEGLPGPLLSN